MSDAKQCVIELREYDDYSAHSKRLIRQQAADLIEQQTARIAELEARAGEAPSFSAKHVSLKQKRDGRLHLTLELNEVEGAPHYTVSPVNPAVVRTHPPTGDAAGKDSVDAARYRWLREQNKRMHYTTDYTSTGTTDLIQMEVPVIGEPVFTKEGHFDFAMELDRAIDSAIASLTKTAEPTLWMLHIEGPDDIVAAPSRAEADAVAVAFNELHGAYLAKRRAETAAAGGDPDHWPSVNAVVVEWDSTAAAHAESVAKYWTEYAAYCKPADRETS